MDVTTYLYHLMKKDDSIQRVYEKLGIDMEKMIKEQEKLDADQFLTICQFLQLDADGIMNQFVEDLFTPSGLAGKENR